MGDLLRCCAALESDRPAERKQAASKILKFIKDADIQATLDSGCKGKRISWPVVFRSVVNYVYMEIEVIRDSSKLSAETIKRRVKDLMELLSIAVHCAEKRGPHLDATDVYKHAVKVLGSDEIPDRLKVMLFNDYTNLLLRCMLCIHRHKIELTAKLYQELMWIYSEAITDYGRQVDRVLAMQTVDHLMDIALGLASFKKGELFAFFQSIFSETRNFRANGFVESSLSALNKFLRTCVIDQRRQSCQLGEVLITNILSLWSKSSQGIKSNILDFMMIQILAHNPDGAFFSEEDNPEDQAKAWKDCIYKLYNCILGELQQIAERIQRTGIRTDSTQTENFVSVAVECFNQILYYEEKEWHHSAEEDPLRKRRKTDCLWSLMLEGIGAVGSAKACIAWSQILESFLKKFPKRLPENQYQPSLKALLQSGKDCRSQELLRWIFRGLAALSSVAACRCFAPVSVLWNQAWVTCMKGASVHGIENSCFQLLTAMLKAGVIIPSSEMFQGFQTSSHKPSRSSSLFILALLEQVPLPVEKNRWKTQLSVLDASDKYFWRKHLLSWIVPVPDMLDVPSMAESMFSHIASNSCAVFASLCLGLVTKSPSAHALVNKAIFQKSRADAGCIHLPDWAETATNCLQYLVHVDTEQLSEEQPGSSGWELSLQHRCNSIAEMCDFFLDRLRNAAGFFKSCDKAEVQHKGKSAFPALLNASGKFAAFLIECARMQEQWRHWPSTFFSDILLIAEVHLRSFVSLLNTMTSDLHTETEKKTGTLLTVLKDLKDALVGQLKRGIKAARDNKGFSTRLTLPSGFATFLGNVLHKKVETGGPDCHQATGSFKSDESTMEFDDFDDPLLSSGASRSSDYVDFGETPQTSKGDSFSAQRHCFSETEMLQLEGHGLLSLIAFSRAFDRSSEKQARDIVTEYMNEQFNVNNYLHIEMLISLADVMRDLGMNLTGGDILIFLEALRQVVSEKRSDQDICQYALTALASVVEIMKTCDTGLDDLEEGQAIIRKLISAFWSLRNEKYSPMVRYQLAKSVHLLIQADPESSWTVIDELPKKKEKAPLRPRQLKMEELFCSLLRDNSQLVRFFVAKQLKVLFKTCDGRPRAAEKQMEAFEQVITATMSMHGEKGSLQEVELHDLASCKAMTTLLALKSVILASSLCEAKALSALFAAHQDEGLDTKLTTRILREIAIQKGHTSPFSYLDNHVNSLLKDWVEQGREIEAFPSGLFHLTIAEFLGKYAEHITAIYIYTGHQDRIGQLSAMIGSESQPGHLVLRSFPRIASYMLPVIQSEGSSEGDGSAVKAWNYALSLISPKSFPELWRSSFVDIITNIMLLLYDRESVFLRETDPEPQPRSYSVPQFETASIYLTSLLGPHEDLHDVLQKQKDGYQQVLLGLALAVEKALDPREKIRLLDAYRLFVASFGDRLTSSKGQQVQSLLRDVIYRLLHWMDSSRECYPVVLDTLKTLLLCCCNSIPSELGKHLNPIVHVLKRSAMGNSARGKQASALLDLILIDRAEDLQQYLYQVDLFAEVPQFRKINESLRQKWKHPQESIIEVLEQYLCKRMTHPAVLSRELLAHLKTKIIMKREDIKQLQSSDQESKVQLYKVAYDLMNVAEASLKSRQDDVEACIGFEAVQCLGALNFLEFDNEMLYTISCCNSETLMINSASNPEGDSEGNGKSRQAAVGRPHFLIVVKLTEFLTEKQIDVVSAAAHALKTIFRTSCGSNLISEITDEEILARLFPFIPNRKQNAGCLSSHRKSLSVVDFSANINQPNLWIPGSLAFEDWVVQLALRLLSSSAVTDEVLLALEGIVGLSNDLARFILPMLVFDILRENDELSSALTACFNQFFHAYADEFLQEQTSHFKEKKVVADRMARTLISVINYLRQQNRSTMERGNSTAWQNNFWLDINYLEVAQVANGCHAYFSAALFCEIWYEVEAENLTEPKIAPQLSQDGPLSTLDQDKAASCRSTLLQAYLGVGERDAIYGVGAGTSPDIGIRIHTYQQEREYTKALVAQDLSRSCIGAADIGISRNLGQLGLNHVMILYSQEAESSFALHPELQEFQFECAWRNSLWELEPETSPVPSYASSIYSSLLAIRDENEDLFHTSILQAARASFGADFIPESEAWGQVAKLLSRASTLTSLRQFGDDFFRGSFTALSCENAVEGDYFLIEDALSLKTTAYRCALQSHSLTPEVKMSLLKSLYDHVMISSECSRRAKLFQVSERELHTLRNLDLQYTLPKTWKVEEAKMFWDRNERSLAMHQLKSLIHEVEQRATNQQLDRLLSFGILHQKQGDPKPITCVQRRNSWSLRHGLLVGVGKREASNEFPEYYPESLGVYGTWLAESRSENPTVIIESYLEKSVRLMEESGMGHRHLVERYWTLAKYASSQYHSTRSYLKSPVFENKKLVIKKAKAEITRLTELHGSSDIPRGSRYWSSLHIQCQEDEEEVRSLLEDQRFFLHKAVANYLKCLQVGDKYDLHILMLCSLWLSNAKDDLVNKIMKKESVKIQSRKFLPLMYQLAARLGTVERQGTPEFQETLEQIIERAAVDHPFHVVYIILALCSADAGPSTSTGRKRTKLETSRPNIENQQRTQSAQRLLDNIRRRKSQVVQQMEELQAAYNELAYWDITHLKMETGNFELPSKFLLRRMNKLNLIPVLTVPTQVDPSCQYCDIVYVTKFEPQFTHCGGVNLPKVVRMIGSDGRRRRQLVKGKDDLRQDAVMQQVFGIVNQLLRGEKETRNLRIRTYKVVPLSQRSGVVEWCEGTMPLGDYLIGSRMSKRTGAHARYHPREWTSIECRKKLTDATSGDGNKSKLSVYKEIMRNFSPVFRHFFLEKFPDPAEWFARRVAYTRSCATSSIVGYLLGLGDRHIQNILIDCRSAELIHIDLGVAFEQGRLLPTPETVPFRLTRDLVDGMGISGVEGVFRRCCKRTLGVMRQSQDAISTIVEVLLYDPLYAWTLSPVKAQEVQRKAADLDTTELQPTMNPTSDVLDEVQTALNANESGSKNKMAERVLIRLKQKLDGNENGSFLSVEGQVNYLIQEARDIKNLCRLFPGWQPWV